MKRNVMQIRREVTKKNTLKSEKEKCVEQSECDSDIE